MTDNQGPGHRKRSPAAEEFPACQSCRNRKLKCSRETPSCSQCSRLGCPCAYDRKRQRPGLRSGAIDSLNRRIDALESLLARDDDGKTGTSPRRVDPHGCIYHAALLIANSITGNVGDHTVSLRGASPCSCDFDSVSSLPRNAFYPTRQGNRSKRRRTDNPHLALDNQSTPLPPEHVLDTIFEAYFKKIHPWLPCVHRPRFEARLKDPQKAEDLTVVIHAMVCVTMKHLKLDDIGLEESERGIQVRVSRDAVTQMAMTSMSVESLQALIIIASDYMAEGNLASASPIIGSLTRTVEYLQLTIETDEKPQQGLLRALRLLRDSESWAEAEERRRVFWNVFILDRLCSVITGWNTSLTSEDVHRRLPSEGNMWARGEHATTPYFGIWNKSAAKIGNPIAYPQATLSALSPETTPAKQNDISPASESLSVGAFAYRIEATESLSQLTSFFLQQPVNFYDRQQISNWLTRFKELDLRLVHWKTFLPSKFRDSNVSFDEAVITMDPNLTLAHMTHNASMILLHQHIAYPPAELQNMVQLPSSCSVETCQLAAMETSSITNKFLAHSRSEIVVAQFPFCAFVAARVLLVHWKATGNSLGNEFFSLLESLWDMSRRWRGALSTTSHETTIGEIYHEPLDLAAKYAALLEGMRAESLTDTDMPPNDLFQFHIAADLCPIRIPVVTSRAGTPSGEVNRRSLSKAVNGRDTVESRNSSTMWEPPALISGPLPVSNQEESFISPYDSCELFDSPPSLRNISVIHPSLRGGASHINGRSSTMTPLTNLQRPLSHLTPKTTASSIRNDAVTTGDMVSEVAQDELAVITNGLLDQNFAALDRVITFDGTDFNFDVSYWNTGNFT